MGRETEMEEGTGGRRRGGKEGNEEGEEQHKMKKEQGQRAFSFYPMVIYFIFQSSPEIH